VIVQSSLPEGLYFVIVVVLVSDPTLATKKSPALLKAMP
jgi:hypothetical protein